MVAMRRVLITWFALLALVASGTGTSLAQDVEPSPAPSASVAPEASFESQETTLVFDDPKWKRISTSRSPAAREDHTWTVDQEGRYAYLFGGRDDDKSFADLWRYDLETDVWKKLSPDGKRPSARFGHSAVWAEGIGMVVFAGQRGTDFFRDLWAYDPVQGQWSELPSRGSAPKPRYGSCMIVAPDGRIQISHGFTSQGRFDDTRAYDLETKRWTDITPAGRRPGERCLHDCFTSSSGQMVLYGGQDNSSSALGDLWVSREDGSWKRAADPRAKARRLYAVTEAGDYAYIFGGAGLGGRALDDLWRVDRETLKFKRVDVPGSSPSARFAGTLISDTARGRLLLFGGKNKVAKADLWQLTGSSVQVAPGEAAAAQSPEPLASADPVVEAIDT